MTESIDPGVDTPRAYARRVIAHKILYPSLSELWLSHQYTPFSVLLSVACQYGCGVDELRGKLSRSTRRRRIIQSIAIAHSCAHNTGVDEICDHFGLRNDFSVNREIEVRRLILTGCNIINYGPAKPIIRIAHSLFMCGVVVT